MSLPNSQLCCSRSGLVIFEASHLFSCSYIVSGKAKHFACSNQWVITRSETTRFHTANGQQEAKRFASIPAIYTIFVLTCKKRNNSLPHRQWETRSEMYRFHSRNICYFCVDVKSCYTLVTTSEMFRFPADTI